MIYAWYITCFLGGMVAASLVILAAARTWPRGPRAS